MRRLLAIWSAVGLLCGALGCHHDHCIHGRCDCDEGPAYGCHYDGCGHSNYGHDHAALAPAGHPAEMLKEMPKDVMPKDDAK